MLPFCSPKLDERLLRVLDTLNVKLHPRLRNADDIGAHLRHEFVRSLIETGRIDQLFKRMRSSSSALT